MRTFAAALIFVFALTAHALPLAPRADPEPTTTVDPGAIFGVPDDEIVTSASVHATVSRSTITALPQPTPAL
ncbi:hypothetical protein DENSPDRAFT_845402 [Dentipellis sp. KUC8613]|nr:hypothetical protein DENSPDRAFT_845402 [Dentipellis sp. KUC8613]